MITIAERRRMRKAHSIGPRMIEYLGEIGIERLEDLRDADARTLALRINAILNRPQINAAGVKALQNLIDLANSA